MKRVLSRVLFVLVLVAVGMQFFRPERSNPPEDPTRTLGAVVTVPANVNDILERACADCHTYRSKWPWYSQVAPVSWFVARHVEEAREHLNLSDFGAYEPYRQQHKLEEIAHEVDEGEMPLSSYLPLHPEAKLSDQERQTLVAWATAERGKILATLDGEPPKRGDGTVP